MKADEKTGDSFAYPPRGLSREEAARYVGVGVTKFAELVAARRMPRPKKVGSRLVWDRFQIDAFFSEMDDERHGLDARLEEARARKRKTHIIPTASR